MQRSIYLRQTLGGRSGSVLMRRRMTPVQSSSSSTSSSTLEGNSILHPLLSAASLLLLHPSSSPLCIAYCCTASKRSVTTNASIEKVSTRDKFLLTAPDTTATTVAGVNKGQQQQLEWKSPMGALKLIRQHFGDNSPIPKRVEDGEEDDSALSSSPTATWRCPLIVIEYFFRIIQLKKGLDAKIDQMTLESPEKVKDSPEARHRVQWNKLFVEQESLAEQIYDLVTELEGAHQLLEESRNSNQEGEMLQMARDEVAGLILRLREAGDNIDALLDAIVDDYDEIGSISNKWTMEIIGRAGGEEAGIFAKELFEMMKIYAETIRGWRIDNQTPSEHNGGVLRIEGEKVWKYLKHELGVHRVQRVPTTESSGRMQTSTASLTLIPVPSAVSGIDVKESDCDISFVRGSGPGGQGMQSSSNCVNLLHRPSGITVKCHQTRSASNNKQLALESVAQQLWKKSYLEKQKENQDLFARQWTSGERAEKMRTYNFQQNRVTDHRLGKDFPCEGFLQCEGNHLNSIHRTLNALDRKANIENAMERMFKENLSY